MVGHTYFSCTASIVALIAAVPALAQTSGNQPAASVAVAATPADASGQDTPPSGAPDATPADQNNGQDIVVSGIRSSLEKAAEIKRDAIQVVDSIVAQDIGKFPDPTTAAALQRVPGVQVQNNNNNELSGVRIRGLTDILTTVDGREVFTTTDRSFDLQDLPAEALARVDVYKSQTADLIEGGVAGAIDLKLNKPFNFKKPTVVLSTRGNYGFQVEELNPQFGILLTDRFQTGIGEIGILLNGTYSNSRSLRTATSLTDRRDSAASPLLSPGYFVPNVLQNVTTAARLKRKQLNGAIQWQATPSLQVYIDGLYTDFKNTVDDVGFNVQPLTTATTITNIVPNSNCFAVRATNTGNTQGQNPTIINSTPPTLQSFAVKTLCDIDRATFLNAVANQTTGSMDNRQTNKLVAGGFKYEGNDGLKADVDIGYQTSTSNNRTVRTAVGQRIPTLTLITNDNDGPRLLVSNDYLTRTNTLSLRNQLIQNFGLSKGSLLQARFDAEQDVGSFIDKLKVGFRYAKRQATFQGVQLNTAVPFGNVGTATEANAKLVSATNLPGSFLALSALEPRVNDGSRFYGPSAPFLRTAAGLNALRAVYNLAPGDPAFDPLRQFDASEATYAGYGQADYKIEFGSTVKLDGVVGVRVTKTNRSLDTFSAPGVAVTTRTSDTDILPNATARLQFAGGFQARLGYSKAIRRPDFTSLNPALNLVIDVNPALLSTGSSGNPNLRPQKSDSFDGTLEHYWKSGFISVTGYYRKIIDRVITSGSQEVINGRTFIIQRPRNVGQATLKGVEVSGQYFFDFLPGALKGFGALGAFTFADSKVGGGDPLAGTPLQGVSKYNYTAGLLYDKYGLSGRVIYTYRSSYIQSDLSGQVQLRRYDSTLPNQVYVPVLLEIVRPSGRLDFSLGYDITPNFRFDIGGTNILRAKTATYRGETSFVGNYYDDETTYTLGLRLRI